METTTNVSPDNYGPIIIVKKRNVEFYRILRMSDVGFRGEGVIFCRLSDLDFPFACFDDLLNRLSFYRNVIEQMIAKGFAIALHQPNQVTNTLHNHIVNFCQQENIKVLLVEFENDEFPF